MAYETLYFSRTSGGYNAEDGDELNFNSSNSISFYGAAKATTFYCSITGGITSSTTSARTHGAKLDIYVNGDFRKIWEGDIYLPARGTTGYTIEFSGTIPADYQKMVAQYGVEEVRLRQTESSAGNNFALRGANASGYIDIYYEEVSLGRPTNITVSQTDTHINVGWSHASYNGSGTRTYYILGENSSIWGGKTTLGSGYTGTSASIAIQDSWRGKTITIYVGATATDWGGEENFGAGVNITPAILGCIRYCDNGTWKECIPYYVVNGVWKECIPYYCDNGVWKEVN